ncbi:hypothetical protein KAU09_00735 [Candidatus Parcubacteria bacterium]|nr:hypothetical protein [Candidatus Parcubacteria bacterium]
MTINKIIKFRIILFLLLFMSVCFFFHKAIVPSGKIVYVNNFEKENYFLGKLSPGERVAMGDKKIENIIIANPVYFNLYTPRAFDKAVLKYRYKNICKIPLIETGALVDKNAWRYDLKPVENRLIDQLSLVWNEIREGDEILLVRPETLGGEAGTSYSNIKDFISNPPSFNQVAAYNYNLNLNYFLEDYHPSEFATQDIPALRGAYQFFVYLKNENLDLNFIFYDLNKNKDSDDFDIRLYFNNELIDFKHIEDDGNISDNGEFSRENNFHVYLANLPEGAYKIEVKANNDIITKTIKSAHKKMAFIHKLELFNSGNQDIKLYTDSNLIQATTIFPESLQTVKINENNLDINETYKQFEISTGNQGTSSEILLQKDGLILSGDGVFAFNPFSLINPKIKKADYNLDVNKAGINYIIAKYKTPQKIGEWSMAEVEIDLAQAYRENNKNSFIISAPALKQKDKKKLYFDLIEIELNGRSLRDKINNLWN